MQDRMALFLLTIFFTSGVFGDEKCDAFWAGVEIDEKKAEKNAISVVSNGFVNLVTNTANSMADNELLMGKTADYVLEDIDEHFEVLGSGKMEHVKGSMLTKTVSPTGGLFKEGVDGVVPTQPKFSIAKPGAYMQYMFDNTKYGALAMKTASAFAGPLLGVALEFGMGFLAPDPQQVAIDCMSTKIKEIEKEVEKNKKMIEDLQNTVDNAVRTNVGTFITESGTKMTVFFKNLLKCLEKNDDKTWVYDQNVCNFDTFHLGKDLYGFLAEASTLYNRWHSLLNADNYVLSLSQIFSEYVKNHVNMISMFVALYKMRGWTTNNDFIQPESYGKTIVKHLMGHDIKYLNHDYQQLISRFEEKENAVLVDSTGGARFVTDYRKSHNRDFDDQICMDICSGIPFCRTAETKVVGSKIYCTIRGNYWEGAYMEIDRLAKKAGYNSDKDDPAKIMSGGQWVPMNDQKDKYPRIIPGTKNKNRNEICVVEIKGQKPVDKGAQGSIERWMDDERIRCYYQYINEEEWNYNGYKFKASCGNGDVFDESCLKQVEFKTQKKEGYNTFEKGNLTPFDRKCSHTSLNHEKLGEDFRAVQIKFNGNYNGNVHSCRYECEKNDCYGFQTKIHDKNNVECYLIKPSINPSLKVSQQLSYDNKKDPTSQICGIPPGSSGTEPVGGLLWQKYEQKSMQECENYREVGRLRLGKEFCALSCNLAVKQKCQAFYISDGGCFHCYNSWSGVRFQDQPGSTLYLRMMGLDEFPDNWTYYHKKPDLTDFERSSRYIKDAVHQIFDVARTVKVVVNHMEKVGDMGIYSDGYIKRCPIGYREDRSRMQDGRAKNGGTNRACANSGLEEIKAENCILDCIPWTCCYVHNTYGNMEGADYMEHRDWFTANECESKIEHCKNKNPACMVQKCSNCEFMGGESQKADGSIEDCKKLCLNDDKCVGIDVGNTNNRCYFVHSITMDTMFTSHYQAWMKSTDCPVAPELAEDAVSDDSDDLNEAAVSIDFDAIDDVKEELLQELFKRLTEEN